MDSQANHPSRKTDRESHGSRIEGFRRTAGPLAESNSRVGTYRGYAGDENSKTGKTSGTHFFSSESTGGGETDSHVIQGDFPHLKQGDRYAFNTDGSHPMSYNDNAHHDLPGAPITEMNKNLPVPGERPKTGPVRTGNDFSGGMVGHVVGGMDGRQVMMSAESTGGGETDSHMFNFPHDKNLPRTLAGKRVVMMPSKDGSFHTIENYNHKSHGHLPGAPLEEE